jgi:hypothetical protein
MAPSELRALATRVAAAEATNEEIAVAVGWHQAEGNSNIWELPGSGRGQLGCPAFLTSLDAAASIMPAGHTTHLGQTDAGTWEAEATPIPYGTGVLHGIAALTEPQARSALALLCLAAEMERASE